MRRTTLAGLGWITLGAFTLNAQDSTRAPLGPADKNPVVARVIGIVPGAGHMYAGETRRGLAYMGGTVGVFLLGTTLFVTECVVSFGARCEEESITDDVTVLATLGVWAWSIYDAGRAAHRTNARRRSRVSLMLTPARSISPHGASGRGLEIGLSLAVY